MAENNIKIEPTTFEEAFYTGFFTYKSRLFGLEVVDLRARYVSYTSMELKNKVTNFPLPPMDAQCRYEFIDRMQLLAQRDKARRPTHGHDKS